VEKLPVAGRRHQVIVIEVIVTELVSRCAVDRVVAAEIELVGQSCRIADDALVGLDDLQFGPQIVE